MYANKLYYQWGYQLTERIGLHEALEGNMRWCEMTKRRTMSAQLINRHAVRAHAELMVASISIGSKPQRFVILSHHCKYVCRFASLSYVCGLIKRNKSNCSNTCFDWQNLIEVLCLVAGFLTITLGYDVNCFMFLRLLLTVKNIL